MEKTPKPLVYKEGMDPDKERNVEEIMDNVKRDLGIILEKMKSSIESHGYGVIVGIDGGGRVPALILGNTLNSIYKSKDQEEIKTFFITGSRNIHIYEEFDTKKEDLRNLFLTEVFQRTKEQGEKVLLVEDVVASGNSLELATRVMQELGLSYEIATLSFDDSKVVDTTYIPEKDIVEIEHRLGSRIIYGEYGGISDLYGSKQMSGVHKESDILYAKPIGQPIEGSKMKNLKIPSVGDPVKLIPDREVLNRTRELVSEISNQLFEEYKK